MTNTNIEAYPEGIYFNMPEEIYHSLPMLSASGMKNILISPTDFYYRSWLNAERDDDQEDSQAMIIGRAYHKRILEGSAAFNALYCSNFVPPEKSLKTVEDMQEALGAIPVSMPSKWKKADYIEACRAWLPDRLIFDDEKKAYEDRIGDRTQLAPDLIERIELAAAMIEKHPELSKCFSGGYPEVTIIWRDEDVRGDDTHGVWFKARIDYLKWRSMSDLKTFTNMQNKPVDMALYSAMAGMKYHIQAAHYLNAGDRAIKFCQRALEGETLVFDNGTPIDIRNPAPIESHGAIATFCQNMSKAEEHAFCFVFQQKGIAPLARGKWFMRGSMYQCGLTSIDKAVGLFKKFYAMFGEDPWVDMSDITAFDDSNFPPWAVEI